MTINGEEKEGKEVKDRRRRRVGNKDDTDDRQIKN